MNGRRILYWLCLGIFLGCCTLSTFAAEDQDESNFKLVFGPRVGVTYLFSQIAEFNDALQQIFPNPERGYFPLITQFGINLEQRIRLGDTKSHFAFQELLLIGGLDQSIVIPNLIVMIGFRSHTGLEFGLGPYMAMSKSEIGIEFSVVYAIGWTFSFKGVYVPVDLAIVPTPADGFPRISLLTGFNFDIVRKRR